MLYVNFIGASDNISGSCTWLYHQESDTQFLVDCGLYQGTLKETIKNDRPFQFSPPNIDYVLLTHAHIDHCGLLARLVNEGFCGLVFATKATKALVMEMLKDSCKVGNRNDEIPCIYKIKWSLIDGDNDLNFKWGVRPITLADGLCFCAFRSSHILGACSYSVTWRIKNERGDMDAGSQKSIYFSGDIGCQHDDNEYLPLLKAGHQPHPQTDYIVTESTYGDRGRDNKFQSEELRRQCLKDTILRTIREKKGKVIIPSFSLHRTQEILFDLAWLLFFGLSEEQKEQTFGARLDQKDTGHLRYEKSIRVLFHSPLGHKITKIYKENLFDKSPNRKTKYARNDLTESYKAVLDSFCGKDRSYYEFGNLLKSHEEGKNRNSDSFDVIVASSGMCDQGPIVNYLNQYEGDPRNTIILTGYQSSKSRGRSYMDRVDIAHTLESDRAEVINMSGYYSAHADKNMLIDNIFNLNNKDSETPAQIFLNHGTPEGKSALANEIIKRNDSIFPGERKITEVRQSKNSWFDLNRNIYVDDKEMKTLTKSYTTNERFEKIENSYVQISDELNELKEMLRMACAHSGALGLPRHSAEKSHQSYL
jgi:metallo-beta-lactamase family protein